MASASAPPGIFQRRIVWGARIWMMAFALVGVRLADVALFSGAVAGGASARSFETRRDLVDRNGELLARDLPVKDLYARPHNFWDKAEAAYGLAGAVGVSGQRLARAFDGNSPYVLVARQITPDAEARVMALGLPGLEFETGAKRSYPNGRAGAQLLGATDPDGMGVSGLELGLNAALRDTRRIDPVVTSIDMRVQYILSAETRAAKEKFSARSAGGVVMDVRTGEVLGMVSLPDYDPNGRFGEHDSRRNMMAQDVYELGSVFKILAFALGLQDHTFRTDEVFPIGNGYKIGKYTIHEAEHMPATLLARDVLGQSSNIGTSQIALRSGGQRQHDFLETFGLLQPLRAELPETARPLFPGPGRWNTIETATIGFGHGISVSPLAFASAAAAIVNGGRKITPTFVRSDRDARGTQLISPETSAKMRELLRYVVTDGTGKKANVPGYDVGGKTGSAEKPGAHGYQAHLLVTSFLAAFPMNDPRYVVFVILDEPHGIKETGGFALAGYTAAPLAGKVIQRIAPLLGVPAQEDPAAPLTLARNN